MRVNDNPNNTYRALRVLDGRNILYSEATAVDDWSFECKPSFVEYYDMDQDPAQLYNLAAAAENAETIAALSARLRTLWKCAGAECP